MSKLKQERLTSADLVASVSQAPKIPDSTLPIMQMGRIFHGEAKSFPVWWTTLGSYFKKQLM